MTKLELIQNVSGKVAAENVNKKQTLAVVDAVFEAVKEAIEKDGHIAYPGFGTFSTRTRAAREGRNPHSGAAIQIPETVTVTFRPAPKFKESLNVNHVVEEKKEVKKAAAKEVKEDKKAAAAKEVKEDKKACKKSCKKSK